jgi:hypothetical protein
VPPFDHVPLLYIDPNTGSLFIQAVIAAIVVVPFFLRNQIRRVVGAVRGTPQETAAAAVSPTDGPTTPDPDAAVDPDPGRSQG